MTTTIREIKATDSNAVLAIRKIESRNYELVVFEGDKINKWMTTKFKSEKMAIRKFEDFKGEFMFQNNGRKY